MVDHLTPQKRSETMSKIRGKDTTPEMEVRRLVHSMGYRYRLHRTDLPGKPDLTFPSLKKIIFVHGCFWHMHKCKRLPKSNTRYWKTKLEENARRDRRVRYQLKKLGWDVLVVWECLTKNPQKLQKRLEKFLSE
jgi:DNA mismatch endonuclease (patch repair protein)